MARHAVVDLAQIFSLRPIVNAPDRLPPERFEALRDLLCQDGVSLCRDAQSTERLREMRALYEGYVEALSRYLQMPLPPWISGHPHKDNWQTVARLRAQTEVAEPHVSQESAPAENPTGILSSIDHPHDF